MLSYPFLHNSYSISLRISFIIIVEDVRPKELIQCEASQLQGLLRLPIAEQIISLQVLQLQASSGD